MKIPGIETGVIIFAAEFKIVLMIGGDVGENAPFAKLHRKDVIERLNRAPAAIQKIMASGHKLAPRRHAGKRTDPMIVENKPGAREAVEIRRLNPLISVTPEIIGPDGIENEEEGLHGLFYKADGCASRLLPRELRFTLRVR